MAVSFLSAFLLLILPLPLLGQQDQRVYLAFDETYVSPFAEAERTLEYEWYGRARDLIQDYVDHARLATADTRDFRNLFSPQARICQDYADALQKVSLDRYVLEAGSAQTEEGLPLWVESAAIAQMALENGQPQLILNLEKRKANGTLVDLQMVLAPEGDAPLRIQSISKGHWEARKARPALHLLGWTGGVHFHPGQNPPSGFSSQNVWSTGLSYQYHMPTGWMDDRLSVVGGLRVGIQRYSTLGAAGSILSNGGTPNALQLEFLTEGQEILDLWSGEALLGFDYAMGPLDRPYGIVAGFTPRLNLLANGNYTGAVAFSEIWDDQVLIRDVVNCGLQSFEGADAVAANYSERLLSLQYGILLQPYWQLSAREGYRWRLALDAQYLVNSALAAAEQPLFLEGIRSNLTPGRSSVRYDASSFRAATSSGGGALYVGLNLSYSWPVRPKIEEESQEESPFSKEQLDDFDGKGYLILNGDITDAEAAARIQKELGPATQFVWIINTTQLESVAIPTISELLKVRVVNNRQLKDVGFPDLEEVYERVEIENNPVLSSIAFPKIEKIYEVSLRDNDQLRRLEWPLLRSCGSELIIQNQPLLDQLYFPVLEEVWGTFSVQDLPALEELQFPSLDTLSGSLSIQQNDALQLIDLSPLRRVKGNISLSANEQLPGLWLPELLEIDGDLSIHGGAQMRQVNAPQLEYIGGFLDIHSLPELTTLAFPELTQVGRSLSCSLLPQMSALSFPAIQVIGADLNLSALTKVTELDFPVLQSVGGSLRLNQLDGLTEWELKDLGAIDHSLQVSNHSNLQRLSFAGLDSVGMISLSGNTLLTTFEVPALQVFNGEGHEGLPYQGHGLWVADNGKLAELHFPGLAHSGGSISLRQNHSLKTFSAPRLQKIQGDLSIDYQRQLQAIDLGALDSLEGKLQLESNGPLVHFELPQLRSIQESLIIQYNKDLKLLRFPRLDYIGGDALTVYNALDRSIIDQIIQVMRQSYDEASTHQIQLEGQLPKVVPSWSARQALQFLEERGYVVGY